MGTTFQGHYNNGKTKINDVYITSDYSLFKLSDFNRSVNHTQVERLVSSFKIRQVMVPIIVNESFVVIDGQHRLEALTQLRLPVPYLIVEGSGESEIQLLNTSSRKWDKADYLEFYSAKGVPAYVEMKRFMTKYPCFGFATAEAILTLNSGGANNKANLSTGAKQNAFQLGYMTIPRPDYSDSCAKYLSELVEFFPLAKQTVFCRAFMILMDKPQFDVYNFLNKFKRHGQNYVAQVNVENTIRAIEEVYNFRSRNPIGLTY